MKMPINEVLDRYSIALLKKERANADNEKELLAFKKVLKKYKKENVEEFLRELLNVNGKIWDLESDIRKGKEGQLGLEEVGRRAIQIREFNKIRISIKNKIVDMFEEGFKDIKINHGSEENEFVIVTLTTVPSRLNDVGLGVKDCLHSLLNQTYDNYEIHFNIPEVYRITQEKYNLPNWLTSISEKNKKLKIFRTDDFGPPTKIIPTIKRIEENSDVLLVVVDDDIIYFEDMIQEHVNQQKKFSNSCIAYDGRNLVNKIFGDMRDTFVECVDQPCDVEQIQHYRSASYRRNLIGEDFFENFVGKTLSDDILISYYFKYKGIRKIIVPIKNFVKFQTFDEWHKFVFSGDVLGKFPMLQHTNSPQYTGCNHPGILEKESRFFIPEEFLNL